MPEEKSTSRSSRKRKKTSFNQNNLDEKQPSLQGRSMSAKAELEARTTPRFFPDRHLSILLACLFVVMTGYGVTLPVLPFHIERLAIAEGVRANDASTHVGAITGVFALMQFFFAPIWGRCSDKFGRRPLLFVGLAGFALSNMFFGLGTNLYMLYASRILGGVLSAAILPVSTAYVADSTTDAERGFGMAWMGSATGLGVIVGPALGGWLSGMDLPVKIRLGILVFDSFSMPFFAAAFLALLALALGMSWLEDPRKSSRSKLSRSLLKTLLLQRAFQMLLYFSFLGQFAMALFEGTFALH